MKRTNRSRQGQGRTGRSLDPREEEEAGETSSLNSQQGPILRKSLQSSPLLQQKTWLEICGFFIKTFSNIDFLSSKEQRTLMKRFFSMALWPKVELNRAESMETMVRKVGEAYERQVPIFARKVKFLELMITKGEGYIQ